MESDNLVHTWCCGLIWEESHCQDEVIFGKIDIRCKILYSESFEIAALYQRVSSATSSIFVVPSTIDTLDMDLVNKWKQLCFFVIQFICLFHNITYIRVNLDVYTHDRLAPSLLITPFSATLGAWLVLEREMLPWGALSLQRCQV